MIVRIPVGRIVRWAADLKDGYTPDDFSGDHAFDAGLADSCWCAACGKHRRALLHWARGRRIRETRVMRSRPQSRFRPAPRSAFSGYRFPPEVIALAVRWYLRFGLSYRDVEELLAERGIEVDHVTVHRWVHRFAPEFAEAAGACRHIVGIAGTSTRRT